MSRSTEPGGVTPPTSAIYRWREGNLELLDYCDMTESILEVADSWLVTDGSVLAIELHRTRFLDSILLRGFELPDAERFWDAAIASLPREGDWFPRVELHSRGGAPLLMFRLRSAPERHRSVVLATHPGGDPRTAPGVKGPDLDTMLRIRTQAQQRGAGEAVILSEGFITEGAYSALLWWRGKFLCAPALEFERVDSVTARSVLGLATALGVDIYYEAVTPSELDGLEVWALSALHGIRIVTSWVDGPATAEMPGRLAQWRRLLDTLRRPLPPALVSVVP
jgi:branched-subunit amino acid aminotransferase/4-amino-4-deoxychorismate lyase